MTIKQRAFDAMTANPELTVRELAAQVGCAFKTAETYRADWRHGGTYRAANPGEEARYQVAELTSYPVQTAVGVMWGPPVQAPRTWRHFGQTPCDGCQYEPECRVYVQQGDLVRCERALVTEVL